MNHDLWNEKVYPIRKSNFRKIKTTLPNIPVHNKRTENVQQGSIKSALACYALLYVAYYIVFSIYSYVSRSEIKQADLKSLNKFFFLVKFQITTKNTSVCKLVVVLFQISFDLFLNVYK